MENVNVEVKPLDHVKLFNKLKNDLMVRLNMREEDASKQAEMIAATFKSAQMA